MTNDNIPDDFLTTCPFCNKMVVTKTLEANFHICPKCDMHLKRCSIDIINKIADQDTFKELFFVDDIKNPINFKGYEDKLKVAKSNTNLDDAIKTGTCLIDNKKVCIAIMDNSFIMGSMGQIVGDKLTCLIEYATDNNLPIICFTTSGGARMQEGIISLMQMAKVSMALKNHHNKGLFYMPILTNPTTGGVTASFAQLGDIIIAEPKALICFAGPRVIKKTINQDLPDGFQRSEFLLKHGFLDAIVERSMQRDYIINILRWIDND